MRVRFQADADLDGRVLRGLRRVAPEIDIRSAADARLAGVPDLEVLRRAAQLGRVLVSQDRRTMPAHFRQYISAGVQSPGVILLREASSAVMLRNVRGFLSRRLRGSDRRRFDARLRLGALPKSRGHGKA